MPKWVNAHRQSTLVELWAETGNKCLSGHPVCRDISHYLKPKRVDCVKVERIIQRDKDNCIVRDDSGNPQYIDKFSIVKDTVYELDTLHDSKQRQLIQDWIALDRADKAYLNRIISRMLHRIPESGSLKGTFNAISRDIYHSGQPQWYIETFGIDGLTFQPFARIRIASSFVRLHVSIDKPFRALSKNAKRRAMRYGKMPANVEDNVGHLCSLAVSRWLNK